METYCHKRGDTFSLGGTVAGLPSGSITARAQLRNPTPPPGAPTLVEELIVSLGAYVDALTPRTLLLEASATAAAAWPVAQLNCDIEFLFSGTKISSKTFTVKVQQDITT